VCIFSSCLPNDLSASLTNLIILFILEELNGPLISVDSGLKELVPV